MRKILILAVLSIALVAMPAFASVQNIKISGDIDSTWLVRDQFDLGDQSNLSDNNFYQNLMITQTRLRVDADLTDNVAATVALINERAWDQDATAANDIDLNLAFVTLREMLYSPLTVTIGRQNFAFGNSFVIDSAGINNIVSSDGLNNVAEDLSKRRALDAVRMTLDYNPLTIDIVAAKIDANTVAGTGPHDDDVDLFGINANYQLGDDMETVVESYFWAKIDQNVKTSRATGAVAGRNRPKADTVYMPGVRATTNPIKGLNVQAELASQFGNKTFTATESASADNINRRALGAQVISSYMLPFEETAQWSPVLSSSYTYVSGDSGEQEPSKINLANPQEYYTAWDPMFENQGGGTIYNTLFNLTNLHVVTFKAQAQPLEDVTASVEWNTLWLNKDLADTDLGSVTEGVCQGTDCFTMNQPDGTTLNPVMTSNRKLGDEIGLALTYDYTEDVQFGARMDWFVPGGAFHIANDRAASQVMINGNVNF